MTAVAGWNLFFVPYCTGDLHAGNNPRAGGGNGVPADQSFVGYANMAHYLKRIVPTITS